MEIRDAIYGDIELSPNEVKLLDTFEMQRLRKIKELALVHLVYPTALHTRFDHSLGVRYCVQHILERSHIEIPRDDKEILYKAALLHDMGHPCFSHITEELEGVPKHTDFVKIMLQGDYRDIVVESGVLYKKEADKIDFVADILTDTEANDILGLIDKKQERDSDKKYLAELLDGYIDADNLDYVRRDGYFLGLSYGNFDDRIYSSFRLVQNATGKKITFSEGYDSVSSIMTFLRARFELFRAAYRHHTVEIADAMLHYSLEAWARDNSDLLFILGDDELLSKMCKSNKAREMILRLQSRQLYKRAYSIDKKSASYAIARAEDMLGNLNKDIEFNRQLVTDANIKYEDILINRVRRNVWKDYGKISIGTEKIHELGDIARNELETLQKMYDMIWNYSVYVSNPYISKTVFDLCKQIFGYDGEFRPKAMIAPEHHDTISQIISDIVREKKSSLKILGLLKYDRKINSEDMATILDLSRSTASHYLTYLQKKFLDNGIDLIKGKRINYKKFWWIDDPLIFEKIKSEIKDYVH